MESAGWGVGRTDGGAAKGCGCCGGCGVEARRAYQAWLCDECILPGPNLCSATAILALTGTWALPIARGSLAMLVIWRLTTLALVNGDFVFVV